MHLMKQVQWQPDVYTKHKQYYPASNISAIFYIKLNVLNVRTINYGPAQVDGYIRTDINAPIRIIIYAHKHHEKRHIHS